MEKHYILARLFDSARGSACDVQSGLQMQFSEEI
jgi:hypothetical protein